MQSEIYSIIIVIDTDNNNKISIKYQGIDGSMMPITVKIYFN